MKNLEVPFSPLCFKKTGLYLLDQRMLPKKEKWIFCKNSRDVYFAIKNMIVRGAPAIGITAAYGLYLGISGMQKNSSRNYFLKRLKEEKLMLESSRPTAVNLTNCLARILVKILKTKETNSDKLKALVLTEAKKIHYEDIEICKRMGDYGIKLFKRNNGILTHCNAGGLATSGYGTALGVLFSLKNRKIPFTVFADETRPLLQGARLTAWELSKMKIPVTLICDNMVASLMRAKKIDKVIVGADRIARNGDTANKIGTYGLAVLAKAHKIPFFVAAPRTTFDFSARTGDMIPVEERTSEEITKIQGMQIAPKGIKVKNPAFDITPFSLITAFITEKGVLLPPFKNSFKKIK